MQEILNTMPPQYRLMYLCGQLLLLWGTMDFVMEEHMYSLGFQAQSDPEPERTFEKRLTAYRKAMVKLHGDKSKEVRDFDVQRGRMKALAEVRAALAHGCFEFVNEADNPHFKFVYFKSTQTPQMHRRDPVTVLVTGQLLDQATLAVINLLRWMEAQSAAVAQWFISQLEQPGGKPLSEVLGGELGGHTIAWGTFISFKGPDQPK
jgi:hypothetical protein